MRNFMICHVPIMCITVAYYRFIRLILSIIDTNICGNDLTIIVQSTLIILTQNFDVIRL